MFEAAQPQASARLPSQCHNSKASTSSAAFEATEPRALELRRRQGAGLSNRNQSPCQPPPCAHSNAQTERTVKLQLLLLFSNVVEFLEPGHELRLGVHTNTRALFIEPRADARSRRKSGGVEKHRYRLCAGANSSSLATRKSRLRAEASRAVHDDDRSAVRNAQEDNRVHSAIHGRARPLERASRRSECLQSCRRERHLRMIARRQRVTGNSSAARSSGIARTA